MLSEINEKINKIKEELALKKVLEEKRESLRAQLKTEERTLEGLRVTLEKEHKDVEKLEKLSFSNLIATVMKNKYEKLEKEQHEYLMAKIKYDHQSSKVALLKESVFSIQDRLKKLKDCESQYRELLDKKLEIIKVNGDTYASSKLIELELDIDKALKTKKEIEEAESVGKSLLGAINSAQDSLESAESWGIWDMFGGDVFSSIAKHNRLNEAEDSFIYISNLLQRFNKELGDVNLASLSFSPTTIAFDIFFDNIFTDFAVQDKINEALSDTSYLNQRVSEIVHKLSQDKESLKLVISNKRKEYEDFIESL